MYASVDQHWNLYLLHINVLADACLRRMETLFLDSSKIILDRSCFSTISIKGDLV